MSRKSRRLSPEEERLWKQVAETTTPIKRVTSPKLSFSQPPKAEPKRPAYAPPKFQVGEKARASDTRITAPDQPVRMDHKAFTRLRRGKSNPEARIDLHGMTAATAHTALNSFLLRAYSEQKRLVLVITGKGRQTDNDDPAPRRAGVLRQQVPHWLDQPPLRQIVLQTSPAHQRHGGSGALYVYLNRRR